MKSRFFLSIVLLLFMAACKSSQVGETSSIDVVLRRQVPIKLNAPADTLSKKWDIKALKTGIIYRDTTERVIQTVFKTDSIIYVQSVAKPITLMDTVQVTDTVSVPIVTLDTTKENPSLVDRLSNFVFYGIITISSLAFIATALFLLKFFKIFKL